MLTPGLMNPETRNGEVQQTVDVLGARRLNALSFFSGAMGLDLGLERAGIRTLLACEIDKDARQTITTNRPDLPLIDNIEDYSAAEIIAAAGLTSTDEVDLIVGGPPCQAFSSAGNRQGFNDDRGNVFLTFIDRILEIQPRFAVIENVRGLLSAALRHVPLSARTTGTSQAIHQRGRGGALNHILALLADAGYGVSFNLYDSANYGTPQRRERVIIVCSRDGQQLPYLSPTHSEKELHGLAPWRTVREAFVNLEGVEHEHTNFASKRLQYFQMLEPGQNWRDLPADVQPEALGGAYRSGGGKTGFYRRLAWDRPSPTLVTSPAMPATALCHPSEDRPISVQEYKRLQEFPDDWVIEGRTLAKYRQIGNAVPLSLGQAVGTLLVNHINGTDQANYPGFSYSRYKNTADVEWRQEFDREQKTSVEQTLLPI